MEHGHYELLSKILKVYHGIREVMTLRTSAIILLEKNKEYEIVFDLKEFRRGEFEIREVR